MLHNVEMFPEFSKFSADVFQAMENLYVLDLGNNLLEEFSKALITEWFTTDGATELEKTHNSSLILNKNPVSKANTAIRHHIDYTILSIIIVYNRYNK